MAVVPHYSSRRYESRHEQEFVDGQPVYNLHHERHYKVSNPTINNTDFFVNELRKLTD